MNEWMNEWINKYSKRASERASKQASITITILLFEEDTYSIDNVLNTTCITKSIFYKELLAYIYTDTNTNTLYTSQVNMSVL